MKNMNWNTLILSLGFGILAYFGKLSVDKAEATHDAVIALRVELDDLKGSMVTRKEYDVEIMQLRTRMAAIELYIQSKKP